MAGAALVVESTGQVLAVSVRKAASARERLRGLLKQPPLRQGEGLMLEPAPQIHTFGLGQPIDVVFCAADGVVEHVVRSMAPRRITRLVVGARCAIELPAGTVPSGLRPGARLRLPF